MKFRAYYVIGKFRIEYVLFVNRIILIHSTFQDIKSGNFLIKKYYLFQQRPIMLPLRTITQSLSAT